MKNAGGQGGICFSFQKDITEVLFRTCSARCDNGYGKPVGKSGKGFVGISGLYAVMVHTGKKHLARTALLRFLCPGKELFVGLHTPTIEITPPTLFRLLGINSQYTNLRAEMLGYLVNQSGTANSRGINGYLVRAGIQKPVYITQFMDSATYGERYADVGGNTLHQFGKCLAPLKTGGNIQKDQLIGPLLTISTRQFNRIACMTQVYKISPFYGLSVFDVKTGDDSLC